MNSLDRSRYALSLCVSALLLADCGGPQDLVGQSPSSRLARPGSDITAKPSHWGIEYQESAEAYAAAGRSSQKQAAGFCSGGDMGYRCSPFPITSPSATVPPISVNAFAHVGMSDASARASGNGAIALGSASANLAATATANGIAAANAVGGQSFTWFDELLPPHATRAHPKGTPIRLTATLSASGDGYNLPCNLSNYFVALASAPNRPKLNQPGGCAGQAPGKPRATAIWKTAYGAEPIRISGQLEVVTTASVRDGGSQSPEFTNIQTTFYLDSPAGVHYRTASGMCYSSTHSC